MQVVRVEEALLRQSGTSADDFPGANWIKITGNVNCVEFAKLPRGTIGLRNSFVPLRDFRDQRKPDAREATPVRGLHRRDGPGRGVLCFKSRRPPFIRSPQSSLRRGLGLKDDHFGPAF